MKPVTVKDLTPEQRRALAKGLDQLVPRPKRGRRG